MTTAHINAIGTAVPPHDVHQTFQVAALGFIEDTKTRALFERMSARSGIENRYSFIETLVRDDGEVTDRQGFYRPGDYPTTAERMARYEEWAPRLALDAVSALDGDIASQGITHVIVASCTGFVAPGLDQILIRETGISGSAERTMVGFMGCYAAVNALRLAHHTVRSEPEARVLVVNVELCSLHLQRTSNVQALLAMLLFGDGATAALVTAETEGIALDDFRAATIPGSDDLITWRVGDQGFVMHLDGRVPGHIAHALETERARNDDGGILRGLSPADYDLWAVHAGGRTILDAVERGLELPEHALAPSREILRRCGNMSSATLMFVLASMLASRRDGADGGKGIGMAFGPGLAAETFRFRLL
jgi:predicted naringenin-chalcone synthase